MKKTKMADLAILLTITALAALVSSLLKANFFISTLLLFGLPSLFLSYKNFKAIKKTAIFSFLITLVPQALFEFRHPGVLSGALYQFLFHEKTFTLSFWQLIGERLPYDYNLLYSKFWINGGMFFGPFFIIVVGLVIKNWKKFWKDDKFKIVFTLCLAPFIGTLFFIGNLGAIYDYYFTGYYLLWILLFSYVLLSFGNTIVGKITVAAFLVILLFQNTISFKESYSVSLDNPTQTSFSGQLSAIDWIYSDAKGREFNFDVYVPPVVPYEFDYLFMWYGNSKYGKVPIKENIPLLYTLYEVDTYHPERLEEWMDRQATIGKVIKEQRFGGIVVQERERISNKK